MDNTFSRLSTQNITYDRPVQGGIGDADSICGDALNVTEDPETSRLNVVVGAKSVCINGVNVKDEEKCEREPLLTSAPKVSPSSVVNSLKRSVVDIEKQGPRVQFESGLEPLASPRGGSISSSSSSSDDDSVSVTEARAPDGGWGWVVVFASFMINLIADGITFSFGVFFVHFLEYFGESAAKTAWIAGIFMSMPLLSGPISSFLTDRFGCRKMTIVGSILSSLGFILSAFVDSIEVLFITLGVLSGFGLSLCYVAAVVVVAYYFDKKRSLATGISVCGSGIGTFLIAPLTNYLLSEYGWRGTMLMMAGFMLNMAVCGMLMRDLPWTTTMNKAKARDRKMSRERKRRKKQGSSVDSFSDSKSSATVATSGTTGYSQMASVTGQMPSSNGLPETARCSSVVNLPTFVGGEEHVPIEVLELIMKRRDVFRALMHTHPGIMVPSRSFSDSGRLHDIDKVVSPRSHLANTDMDTREQSSGSKNNRVPPAFLKDLRLHRRSLTYRGAMLNINRYRLRASSCPNIFRNSMTTIAKEKEVWYAGLWDFWDLIVDVFDFSHLANPSFLIFSISNFLLYVWYDIPYVYLTDHALNLGFSESNASMLISTIGIVNMFGEIIIGWIGDWPNMDAGVVYALSILLCGGVTFLLPFLTDYITLSAASGAFGFFISANYSLTSCILVQLITLEKFTNAYGLLLLMQGIANLVGPPLAGWIYDVTESYDLTFYLSGVFIAVSGLFMLVLPLVKLIKKYLKKEPEINGVSIENGNIKNGNEKFYL